MATRDVAELHAFLVDAARDCDGRNGDARHNPDAHARAGQGLDCSEPGASRSRPQDRRDGALGHRQGCCLADIFRALMDLLQVLPSFSSQPFSNLLPSLERNRITVSDVLLFDLHEIAKRAQLPPREVGRLRAAVLDALHQQLGVHEDGPVSGPDLLQWQTVSTLDDGLDMALGRGVPAGYLSEVTGESGAGKTQFLLTLLLSVQLPAPYGLNRAALYISTEAPLPTRRLEQILNSHPGLETLPASSKPSLSRILSIQTQDLESQEHILRFQLPVAVKRHNIGLVVIDSITANYRAELDRSDANRRGIGGMARRSSQLVELGSMLRDLARAENVAIVVANQVADRFQHEAPRLNRPQQSTGAEPDVLWSSPRTQSSGIEAIAEGEHNPLTLEHQQRWFTGWGDVNSTNLKTPSLGLVWTNEIACRIALIKTPSMRRDPEKSRWRRHFRLVFAPWVTGAEDTDGVEFEILQQGLRTVDRMKDTS